MRQRHAYAATDQIVLDYRIETADNPPALMGDIISTASHPKLLPEGARHRADQAD